MQIVIAGKDPTSLEEYLTEHGHTVKCFYVNDLCLDIARAYNPDVFIYMDDVFDKVPHEQALRSLKDYRLLIVTVKENSFIPYAAALGIKDFVFQPCELSAILHRIENPATKEDAAEMLRHMPKVEVKHELVSEKPPAKPKHCQRFWRSKGSPEAIPGSLKENSVKKSTKHRAKNTTSKKAKEAPVKTKINSKKTPKTLFTKTGYIKDGVFCKTEFKDIREGLQTSCEAVVIPASWGTKAIKEYQRDVRAKTTPLVVIKGKQEHLSAGADWCVKRITPRLIRDATNMSLRLKELWKAIETDPLTGLYTKRFLNVWINEQEDLGKKYSAVMIDLDKFKGINDNYGHSAGDVVLATFGEFLKSESRAVDFVARYGGEEFYIGLPNTTASQAKYLIDRIREKWEERCVVLEDGTQIKTTFSAGVSEWHQGSNTIAEADKMLYKAKEKGRNQVRATNDKILILGEIDIDKASITYNPDEASVAISDAANANYAPEKLPLYVISTGTISDWAIKRNRPDAVFCVSAEEALNKIETPTITVLPGARGNDKGMTIPNHGVLYVVSPSRPALAGEIAAALCKSTINCALVCASPESMGAVSLGVSIKTLVNTDWRFPGAEAPLDWDGIKVWPIDPYKYTDTQSDAKSVVDQIKSRFSLVIIDCASSLDLCTRVARNEGILVLTREGDASDQVTQQWLKTYGGVNVTVANPNELPVLKEVDNGFILSREFINLAFPGTR